MAKVRIRYYVVRQGRGYWQPTAAMKRQGFAARTLGQDGPEAWAAAEAMNAAWDRHRSGAGETKLITPGSLADVFRRYRGMDAWSRKKVRTREEWEDVWGVLEPVLGDVPVTEIDAELCDAFYQRLRALYSLHRRHRIFKVFRALMNVAIALQLITENPTLIVANEAPKGRSEIWSEGEQRRLAARAWKRGYRGLAVAIRIAYDSQLQPVDVRSLKLAQRRTDGAGTYFDTARAKTEKRAFATLSKATERMLDVYLERLDMTLHPDAPLIRTRTGAAYTTKDLLAKDFRTIRRELFPGDTRRLQDMRRTGNVEAAVGGAAPAHLSAKSGNTIGRSNALFETYTPVQLAAVREADAARAIGRARLKGNKPGGTV